MILLPRPKKVEEKQGFYELSFQSVIVIGEELGENGAIYAAVLQDSLKKSTGIACAFIKGKKRPGDIFLTARRELQDVICCEL